MPLYGKLLKYSGLYKVGIVDIEILARNLRTLSYIKRENTHLLALETVLSTIYYAAHIHGGVDRHPRVRGGRGQHGYQSRETNSAKDMRNMPASLSGQPCASFTYHVVHKC
jgi:hypothetical protein